MWVYETMKIRDDVTALVCDRYQDDEITEKVKSNLGIHTNFRTEDLRDCFCSCKTRILYIVGENVSGITEIEFI